MRLFVVLSLIFFCVFAQTTINFQGNATLTNGNDFTYRSLTFAQFNNIVYEGYLMSSLSITSNPTSLTIDGLFGAAYASIFISPSAYLSFFSSASKWQTNGTNYGSINTTEAGAFMGEVFVQLDEVTPANAVVQTIALNTLSYAISATVTGNVNLQAATFAAVKGMMTVNITFIAASVVGVLNVPGNAIITPKSLESMLVINNFPYLNNANSVRLTMLVASAGGVVNAQGSFTHYSSGAANNGAFFTVSQVAQTDGAITPVSISGFTQVQSALTYGNPFFDAQVKTTYGAAASVKTVTITFKAGAKTIVFDPAIGAGASYPSSGAGRLSFPLLAILAAFIKIFFL